MDTNYFNESEATAFDKLEAFNEIIKAFEGIERMKKGWHSDATGKTKNGRYNIELKDREILLMDNGKISGHSKTSGRDYIDDGIMIESHKVADLLLDVIDGYEPLYVNFMLNGIAIFNLRKLSIRPRKSKNMNVKSLGYEKFEIAKRQFLDITDATVYDSNNNLIKRAGEEWKGWKKNS